TLHRCAAIPRGPGADAQNGHFDGIRTNRACTARTFAARLVRQNYCRLRAPRCSETGAGIPADPWKRVSQVAVHGPQNTGTAPRHRIPGLGKASAYPAPTAKGRSSLATVQAKSI